MPVNECIKMRRVQCSEMGGLAPDPVDAKAREIAEPIVNAIKARGEEALLEYAVKLGDLKEGEKHIYSKADLEAAWKGISEEEQGSFNVPPTGSESLPRHNGTPLRR